MVTGPRWPQDRWISPTSLKSYRECPRRVRLQYVEQVPYPRTFNLFFTKGNTVHLALKRIAESLRRGRPPITDAAVMEMARLHLPPQEFPSEDARLAEAHHILHCVQRGRGYIEQLQNPRWLLIEQCLERPWNLYRHLPPYRIVAKPDLVVERDDQHGERIVEIIDYKTGTPWLDEMPPVMMRFVARTLLENAGIDPDTAPVRFTFLWLSTGQRDVLDLDQDFVSVHWNETFRSMKRLAAESDWCATPSSHCSYCPYFGSVCTEQIPYEDGLGR